MKELDIRYVKIKEAVRITGESGWNIRYGIRAGNIEHKKLPSGGIRVGVLSNGQLVYKEVVNA